MKGVKEKMGNDTPIVIDKGTELDQSFDLLGFDSLPLMLCFFPLYCCWVVSLIKMIKRKWPPNALLLENGVQSQAQSTFL